MNKEKIKFMELVFKGIAMINLKIDILNDLEKTNHEEEWINEVDNFLKSFENPKESNTEEKIKGALDK